MAKLCVQAYVRVVYDDVEQVVLLNNLYTQTVYKSESGRFELRKLQEEKGIVDRLQSALEEKLSKSGRSTEKLNVQHDTMLCFVYNEEEQQNGDYYLLNATQPKKLSGNKARRILNTQYETLQIDVENYEDGVVTTIVETLIGNMQ